MTEEKRLDFEKRAWLDRCDEMLKKHSWDLVRYIEEHTGISVHAHAGVSKEAGATKEKGKSENTQSKRRGEGDTGVEEEAQGHEIAMRTCGDIAQDLLCWIIAESHEHAQHTQQSQLHAYAPHARGNDVSSGAPSSDEPGDVCAPLSDDADLDTYRYCIQGIKVLHLRV